MDIKSHIKEQLMGLNQEQLCRFSWLCGIRALPFLGVNMDFRYWEKAKRQEYLYHIFFALDVGALLSFSVKLTDEIVTKAYADAMGVASASTFARVAFGKIGVDSTIAEIAARAVYYTVPNAYTAVDSVTYSAAIAIDRFFETIGLANASFDAWGSILLKDIEAITKKKLNEYNCDISIYGGLWNNFQENLKAVGCAYWARFYEDLFGNGFDIDKKLLKRRINIPDEIKAEGAAYVGRYLDGLGDEIEVLHEARIIILGEKGAGKTSIARKLRNINANMPNDNESTEGVETHFWKIPANGRAKSVNAYIWDFAGHSITHAAHRCFMAARCLYIYVYNGRIERDNAPAYWLEQIRIHGGDSPILFLINEKDDHRADIEKKTLKNNYPSIIGYYNVDIGSDNKTDLQKFRHIVMDTVRNNPSWNSQIVSKEAYKIKNKLREYFNKEKSSPCITRDKFDSIARNCGLLNKQSVENVLADLHTLGICFWYNTPEMDDFNTLVLNPDWITTGIYKIINKSFKECKHILSVAKGTEILKQDQRYKYPRDKVAYLFRLMKLYELAFFKDTDNIFIPGILPLEWVDELPTFDNANDRLTMDFNVKNVLPPNIVARIMVQRHKEIYNENLLWRKGAVLKYENGDAIALVKEDAQNVTVHVIGKDKSAYFASLRETIKTIFDKYPHIKPELLYEILIPEGTTIGTIVMIPEKTIAAHVKKKVSYFDPITESYISLDELSKTYPMVNVTNIATDVLNINQSQQSVNVIGNGNNAVLNSPNAMASTVVSQNFPDTVTEELFNQMLEMLRDFMKSEQADELKIKDMRTLQTEIDETNNLGYESGWARLRKFLSDTANVTTLGTAISMYLAKHPGLPQTILSMFGL